MPLSVKTNDEGAYEMALPPASVLEWAIAAVGRGARVDGVEALREDSGVRGPWLLHISTGGSNIDAVLKTGPVDRRTTAKNTTTHVSIRSSMASEAAALTLAESHGLAAPRLIAVDLDGRCGRLAILSTAIPGRSGAPDIASLGALAEAAAKMHSIALTPRPDAIADSATAGR